MGKLTKKQVTLLTERALQSARPPMKRWLGEGPRGYDAADDIATGVARGIEKGLTELGLMPNKE